MATGTCPHVRAQWCFTGPVGALRAGKMRSQETPDPSVGPSVPKNCLCTVPAFPPASCGHPVPTRTQEGVTRRRRAAAWLRQILMRAFGWVSPPPLLEDSSVGGGRSQERVLAEAWERAAGSKAPPGVDAAVYRVACVWNRYFCAPGSNT